MRFQIKHEIKGRLRVHVIRKRMSFSQADTLQYYLMGLTGVQKVKVQNRTCDAIIEYDGPRGDFEGASEIFVSADRGAGGLS